MAKPGYMTAKPAAPSALRVAFDQRVFPVAIDLAGSVEGVLQRMGERVRAAPGPCLMAAAGAGALLAFAPRLWRRAARS